jgi:hypothetical protein
VVSAEQRKLDAFCFRVREQRSGWNVLVPVPGSGMVDLALLLRDAPEFIGMESGHALRSVSFPFADKDLTPGRLTLILDEAGSIALAAAPAPSRDSATALVRDVLAAHARFWRMGGEEFLKLAEQRLGKPVSVPMRQLAGTDWDEKSFRTGLEAGLQRGRFPVFVLAATLEPELLSAIGYLREMSLAVTALGVELYESWGVEVLLARSHVLPEMAGDRPRPLHRPMPPPGAAPAQAAAARPQVQPVATRPVKPEEPKARTTISFVPPPGFGSLDGIPPIGAKPEPAKPEPEEPQPASHIWSGTQPGVMAGKRPAPRPKGKPR